MKKLFYLFALGVILLPACSADIDVEIPDNENIKINADVDAENLDINLNEGGQVDSESGEIMESFTSDDISLLGKDYEHSFYTMSYPAEYSSKEIQKSLTQFIGEDGQVWMFVNVIDEESDPYARFTKIGDVSFNDGQGTVWFGEGYCDGPAAENCSESRLTYVLYDGIRTYQISIIGTAEENEMTKAVLDSFNLK